MVKLYKVSPNGDKKQIIQQRIEQLAPAGGASEGALASVSTPEKLLTVNSPVVLVNDDILAVEVTPDSSKTIGTVTKTIWSIPTVTPSGSSALGRSQFANQALTAIAIVAATPTIIAGYKVVEGSLRVAGKIYLDLQDNA